MSYLSTIQRLAENPEELELTYQQAVRAGEQAAFAEAVETQYAGSGANLLLAAWHYRLAPRGRRGQEAGHRVGLGAAAGRAQRAAAVAAIR